MIVHHLQSWAATKTSTASGGSGGCKQNHRAARTADAALRSAPRRMGLWLDNLMEVCVVDALNSNTVSHAKPHPAAAAAATPDWHSNGKFAGVLSLRVYDETAGLHKHGPYASVQPACGDFRQSFSIPETLVSSSCLSGDHKRLIWGCRFLSQQDNEAVKARQNYTAACGPAA